MNLVLFAGASNQKKMVSFYHGDHLEFAPPAITSWAYIATLWLKNAPVGRWFIDGEKISNFDYQWVIVEVKEMFPE